jgi:hypothetical protein
MAHDLPDRRALTRRSNAAFNVLQYDMLGEMASSLGHHGERVERAMAALKSFDASTGTPGDRLKLVRKAAREVWAFFVQRELCGFRNNNDVIKQYAIPGEVLARLGAIEHSQTG